MDGWSFTRHLVASNWEGFPSFHSRRTRAVARERALQAGAWNSFDKPSTQPALPNAIDAAAGRPLAGRSQMSSRWYAIAG